MEETAVCFLADETLISQRKTTLLLLGCNQAMKAYLPYLLGRKFDLFTDHKYIKWILTRSSENTGQLWR